MVVIKKITVNFQLSTEPKGAFIWKRRRLLRFACP
nr:MAG TPA: hypothetical protein [Caudoviricetes sp.]